MVLQVSKCWLHRVGQVRRGLLDDTDVRRKDRVWPIHRERQVLKRTLRFRLDHHGTAHHRRVNHLTTNAVAGLDVVEDPVAQTAYRMVGAVGADTVREHHVGMFWFLKHRVLAEQERLRCLFAKHQKRHTAVELTDPHVDHRHRSVFKTGIQIVVLHLALGHFPIGVGVAAVTASSTCVLRDDTFHFVNVPAHLRSGVFVLDKAVKLVKQILAAGTGNFD